MSLLDAAIDTLYHELNAAEDTNDGIDSALSALKEVLVKEGQKSVELTPEKLPNNTRPGRRMLQSYAKKRGVSITFPKS